MNKIAKYISITLLSLIGLSSCKYIGTSEPPRIETSEKQGGLEKELTKEQKKIFEGAKNAVMSDYAPDMEPVREKLYNIIFNEYKPAVDSLVTEGNIDWLVNNGFIDPNLVKDGKNLRELERCIFSIQFYPIWSNLSENYKNEIQIATATTFLANNSQTPIFRGDYYANSKLQDFFVVNFNSIVEDHQKNDVLYLVFEKDAKGDYKVYTNDQIKALFKKEIDKFYGEVMRQSKDDKERLALLPGCPNITKY